MKINSQHPVLVFCKSRSHLQI